MWKKVVGPTLLVIVIWLTLSSFTTYYIEWLCMSQDRILQENVATIRASATMQKVLWRMQAFAYNSRHQQLELRDEQQPTLADLEAEFERALAAAERAVSHGADEPLLRKIREQYGLYREHLGRGLQHSANGRGSPRFPSRETLHLSRSVIDACRKLTIENERMVEQSVISRAQIAHSVFYLRIAVLIIGPALGLVLGVSASRRMNQSISQISVTLQDAAGELSRNVGQVKLSNSHDLSELHQQVQTVVSKMREVAVELQQARQDVLQADRLAAVGEMAAGVAHELRNPLTSVKLLIQTATHRDSNNTLDEQQLKIVLAEIARMEATIQSLLDFSRPPTLRRLHHDLRDTLRRAINLVEARANQQDVSIAAEFPKQRVPLLADPEQLHQVFVNLLLNGLEAMSHGGTLRISVTTEVDGPSNSVCRVHFADSGHGIPDPILPRVFEPFVTTKERGTGLGLAVSRRIVEEHGGTLLAANQDESGAVFTVELQLDDTHELKSSLDVPRALREQRYVQVAGH
jgi:signal transduction histidine kinase